MKKVGTLLGYIFIGILFWAIVISMCGKGSNNTTTISTPQETRPLTAAEKRSMRDAYASRLQNNFYDKNMNIKVRVQGRNKDRLHLTYILFNEVWVHHFQKGSLINEIESMGFKKVILSQGRYYQSKYWTITLNPPR
mgnify:CR=1 FL=1